MAISKPLLPISSALFLVVQFDPNLEKISEVSGSHCGEYEGGCLLGCSAV
jgi:hypothetical protein